MELAIDVGGTFTDLVAVDRKSGSVQVLKYPTYRDDLAGGVRGCLEESRVDISSLSAFTHGTTVAINSLIERQGVKTALITTKGARDLYTIGRGNRPDAYDVFFRRPRPLVPRSLTFEIDERLRATGEVLTPLAEPDIDAVIDAVSDAGVEAVAICLLHSYANPVHEQILTKELTRRLPGLYVTASHEILRAYREYERTSTTVINSYVGPPVSAYLRQLQQVLRDKGFAGSLRIMQSNGGVCSLETAARKPVSLLESGPVAGIAAASHVARALGVSKVVAFDMGGTTAKASLSEEGAARVSDGYFVGGYASGQPVMMPVVDVVEVGSGGGSIAALDGQGRLSVGPESAGANPGPVCYQRGGTRPTVTDADLVLGRIGASSFLGGRMPLHREAAMEAVAGQIAQPLGISVEEAAAAIIAIAVDRMTLAVREVSVASGVDPRECTMVAFGGAGPVHAVEIARELGIPAVLIPNYPSQFSAYGMLVTGVRHDYVRTHMCAIDDADWSAIDSIRDEMLNEARGQFARDGLNPDDLVADFFIDVRFVGQESVLAVPVRLGGAGSIATVLSEDFLAMHDKLYGHAGAGVKLEMVNIKLAAGLPPSPAAGKLVAAGHGSSTVTRRLYLPLEREFAEVPVVPRGALRPGETVTGPALIEEPDTTTYLGRGDVAQAAPSGELMVSVHIPSATA